MLGTMSWAGVGGRPSLDQTVMVLATEFSHTPRINDNDGRDHDKELFSCLLVGARINVLWSRQAGHTPKQRTLRGSAKSGHDLRPAARGPRTGGVIRSCSELRTAGLRANHPSCSPSSRRRNQPGGCPQLDLMSCRHRDDPRKCPFGL